MLRKIVAWLQAYVDAQQNRIAAIKVYDKALSYYSAKNYRNAFPLMEEAASLGEKNAMALLGTMYLMGNGVIENGKEAVAWLQKAVDAGQIDAIGTLGMAYVTGKAKIKRDMKLGQELLHKAAELGDQQSVRMLEAIQNGEGMFAKKQPKNTHTLH